VRRAGASLALVAAAAAAVAACGACGKKKQKARTGGPPPVELVSVGALADGGVGKPSESDEREPNDGADVATALAPGTAVRGRIEPDNEADYYRIEVAQAGGLSVVLGAVPGVDLTLEIEDAGGTSLAKSDRGAANVVALHRDRPQEGDPGEEAGPAEEGRAAAARAAARLGAAVPDHGAGRAVLEDRRARAR
jgi:hypothetical protein